MLSQFKNTNLILAPMAGITDMPFRRICNKFGADITVTEMVSARGLIEGSEKSFKLLHIDKDEKNTGIQIFGNDPLVMARAAKIVSRFNPAFIDINAGCPAKKVIKSGSGGGLLNDLDNFKRVLNAVVENSEVPVTCKTRIGFADDYSDEIIDIIYEAGIRKIAIHGRTVKMGFKGSANYDWCKHINKFHDVRFALNGDIDSPRMAMDLILQYPGTDIMIGRGALGNPFIFEKIKKAILGELINDISYKIWFDTVREHYNLMLEYYGDYGLILMRKHVGWYLKGMRNSKKIKDFIFRSNNYKEIIEVLGEYDRT
ncbi:tRNA-dihydrouridine synthase [candidate division WOR-3 bacterium]|nr:tRNA-dihydrouridine synthase [candidate division WOR-3 bacterium]